MTISSSSGIFIRYMNEKITPQNWNKKDIDTLIELYPETRNIDIALKLNKNIKYIIYMAVKLKLRKTKNFKGRMISKRNKMIGRDLTFDVLKQIASKYKSRGEFQTKDPSAYTTARLAGYLPEICNHMSVTGFSIPQLILKDIMDNLLKLDSLYNSKKIIPPYEIDIFYPSLNLAFEYNGKGWHKNNNRDIIKHQLLKDKNINIIYINERNRKYEEDIKIQIIEHLDEINKICNISILKEEVYNYKVNNVYQTIYNKNDLLSIAKKYSSFSDFKKKELSAYNKLWKMKLIDEATSHMKDRRRLHTIKDVKKTISKYYNLRDLIENDFGTYVYIQRNKLHYLINHLHSRYKHQI